MSDNTIKFIVYSIFFLICLLFAIIKIRSEDPEYIKKKEEQEKKQNQKAMVRNVRNGSLQACAEFYNNCKSVGIRDLSKPADRERIVLYAKSIQLTGTQAELIEAFNKGKEIARKEQEKQEKADFEQRKAAAKEEESQLISQSRKYLPFTGRDKSIEICKDMVQFYEQEIKAWKKKEKSDSNAAQSMMKEETDWAVAGGIASGLAGGAAGLAAAIDAQINNADIRSYNQAVGNLALNAFVANSRGRAEAEANKEKWQAMLEKAKRSLCEMQNSDALFKLLEINVLKSTQSITGAVKVKVKVKQKTAALIYGDVPAVVDGSIRILILDEDQSTLKSGESIQGTLKFGEGILVLPLNGTSKVCQSEVICTNSRGYAIPEKYSVIVVPNKLWAIEKI